MLVDPPYESSPDFFFPGQRQDTILDRDGRAWSARQARVELADVPFLKLGPKLNKPFRRHLASGRFRFADCVRWAQFMLETPAVRLEVATCTLHLGSQDPVAVRLEPKQFAIYLWHALRIRAGTAPVDVSSDEELIGLLRVRDRLGSLPRPTRGGRTPDLAELAARTLPSEFHEPHSRIASALELAIGPHARQQYAIVPVGTDGDGSARSRTLYTIPGLDADAIRIDDPEGDDWEALLRDG